MLFLHAEVFVVDGTVLCTLVTILQYTVDDKPVSRVILTVSEHGIKHLGCLVDGVADTTKVTVQQIFNLCRVDVDGTLCVLVASAHIVHDGSQVYKILVAALVRLCPLWHILVPRSILVERHTRPRLVCYHLCERLDRRRNKGVPASATFKEVYWHKLTELASNLVCQLLACVMFLSAYSTHGKLAHSVHGSVLNRERDTYPLLIHARKTEHDV